MQSEAKGRARYDSKQGSKGRQPGKVTTTGKSKAARQGRQARQESKTGTQGGQARQECNATRNSSPSLNASRMTKVRKVLRISHALKVDTDHHRFMEPSGNKEHMPRDAHAKKIDMLKIIRPFVS